MSFLQKFICCGSSKSDVRSPDPVGLSKTAPMAFFCEMCNQKFPHKNILANHQLSCNKDLKNQSKISSSRNRSRVVSMNDSREDETKQRSADRSNSRKKTSDKNGKNDKSISENCSPSYLDTTQRSERSVDRGSERSRSNVHKLSPAIEEEINKLVTDLMNKPSKANRERELGFITKYINKKTPAKFLVSEKWIENYTSYLNGSSKKTPEAIDNEHLKQLVLTKSLPTNIYLINEIIWRFIQKIYGGGPEIKQCNKAIQLVNGAEYSDHLNETRTADTFSHSDSMRTSLLDTQKSGWLPRASLYQPVGLANPSFYCYMNSCLQMILGITDLSGYISDEKYKSQIKGESRFWKSMAEVVQGQTRHLNYLTPKGLRQISTKCFDPTQQHDSHEFMRFLLSGMQDEVNLTPPKKEVTFQNPDSAWIYYRQSNISIVDDLLAGQLVSTVICGHCRHASNAYDPFLDLSFTIIPEKTKTLADCLTVFQSEEELDSYKCEKCKKEARAKKRLSIHRFPKNLVINLKRFQTYPKKKKLKDQISYPIFDWKITSDYNKEVNSYSLLGVIVHDGPIDSGHYVCYSKRGDEWYLCDDESISKVDEEEVVSKQAYVLLYEKNELGVSKL